MTRRAAVPLAGQTIAERAAYTVSIRRMTHHPEWVQVRFYKSWWRLGRGTSFKNLAETAFLAEGMDERDVYESALKELLRALADQLA